MATNGGTHKFNKNDNNWLHKYFEPQQVDVVINLSVFAQTHPLTHTQQSETVRFSVSPVEETGVPGGNH